MTTAILYLYAFFFVISLLYCYDLIDLHYKLNLTFCPYKYAICKFSYFWPLNKTKVFFLPRVWAPKYTLTIYLFIHPSIHLFMYSFIYFTVLSKASAMDVLQFWVWTPKHGNFFKHFYSFIQLRFCLKAKQWMFCNLQLIILICSVSESDHFCCRQQHQNWESTG